MTPKLIVSDGRTQRELLLVGNLVVGRDPVCDISGDDALLSRRHAEFVVTSGVVRVQDLGSRNGIYVNGRKVAEAKLAPGDVLAIGHFQIKFVEDATPLGSAVPSVTPIAKPAVAPPVSPAAPPAAPAAAPPPSAGNDEDVTRYVGPPKAVPSPSPAMPAPSGNDDDDLTRVVTPPKASPPAPRRAPAQEDDRDSTRVVSPPSRPAGYEDHDETRFVAGPGMPPRPTAVGSGSIPSSIVAPAPAPPAEKRASAPTLSPTATPPLGVVAIPVTDPAGAAPPAPAAALAPATAGVATAFVYGYVAMAAVVAAIAFASAFQMGGGSAAWLAGAAVVSAVAVGGVGAALGSRIAAMLGDHRAGR